MAVEASNRHDCGMSEAADAIIEMVDRETEAWNNKDADGLLTLFHEDMVWPWPTGVRSHDPVEWTTGF